jgi:hypothetical protein
LALTRGQPVSNETIIYRSIIKTEVRRELFVSTRKFKAKFFQEINSACLPVGFNTVSESFESRTGLRLEENPESRKTRTQTRTESGLVFENPDLTFENLDSK